MRKLLSWLEKKKKNKKDSRLILSFCRVSKIEEISPALQKVDVVQFFDGRAASFPASYLYVRNKGLADMFIKEFGWWEYNSTANKNQPCVKVLGTELLPLEVMESAHIKVIVKEGV